MGRVFGTNIQEQERRPTKIFSITNKMTHKKNDKITHIRQNHHINLQLTIAISVAKYLILSFRKEHLKQYIPQPRAHLMKNVNTNKEGIAA